MKATSSSDTDSKSRFMQRLESMAEYAESRVDLDDDSAELMSYLTLEPEPISPLVVRMLTFPSPSSGNNNIPSDNTPLSFLGLD